MNEVKIKLATMADAPAIALLGRITFTETFGHLFRIKKELLDYYERTFSVSKIRSSLNNSNNVFWLAYADDLPVGYAKLKLRSESEFLPYENVGQLQKIYVLKDFLSLGIGLKLQNQLIERAIYGKTEYIWLSVLNSNNRAVNFYLKNGFEKIGSHDFRIGSENFYFYVMSKELK